MCVFQDDNLAGMLTVEENIMFSASLRFPESVSLDEKKQKVNDVIETLGLQKCAQTKVIYMVA